MTTVTPAPQYSTHLPESTKVLLPVLPEVILVPVVLLTILKYLQTVPLIAQVPDVVTTSIPAETVEGDACVPGVAKAKEIVQISQVLPGYAPSYAQEYVPTEVSEERFCPEDDAEVISIAGQQSFFLSICKHHLI